MKTAFLATAAALAFAVPAAAQTQLEAALGVTPGEFTTAELIQLDRAYEENDTNTINFILSGGSNLSPEEIERRGLEQAVNRAIEEGDVTFARNLLDARGVTQDGTTVSARGGADLPVWLQNVADDLRIDASDFTRGELIALAFRHEEGDTGAVQGMISRITQ